MFRSGFEQRRFTSDLDGLLDAANLKPEIELLARGNADHETAPVQFLEARLSAEKRKRVARPARISESFDGKIALPAGW